jgi:enoyl-CoA hydratase/carnithine racemase
MSFSGDFAVSPQARLVRTIANATKPIVAAVHGMAVGIGTTMLLHCDLVYGTPDVTLSTPFVDMGLVPEAGSTILFPAYIGLQRASALLSSTPGPSNVARASDRRDMPRHFSDGTTFG